MIQRLDVEGIHMTLDESINKYVQKKIASLDKYMPRAIRQSVHGEVLLKEAKSSSKNKCTCEVVLHLPKEVMSVQASTVNIYAAIDIVEVKLKQKIIKYKNLHNQGKLRRKLLGRLSKVSLKSS